MGLNHISIAAVIALLGAAPALHAEDTVPQPGNTAAATPAPAANPAVPPTPATTPAAPVAVPPAAVADPALQASPIAGPTQAAPAAAAPETAAPATTKGDVIKAPKKKSATKTKTAPSVPVKVEEEGMPGRGASMSQVEKYFGQPREKLAPVGNPPITRWIYSNYTVYFEHQYVIHSVKNETSAEPAAPAQPAVAEPPMQPSAPEPAATAPDSVAPTGQPTAPSLPETATPPLAEPTEVSPASGQ